MASNGLTVMEGADAAGIELPSECRAGMCATCRARLTSGRVHMRSNMALEEHEIAAGFVLACQSEPFTDEIALNFDAEP
jgi:ring-1,2-phenylacetyl-CoA epoxidase subunit PaaE